MPVQVFQTLLLLRICFISVDFNNIQNINHKIQQEHLCPSLIYISSTFFKSRNERYIIEPLKNTEILSIIAFLYAVETHKSSIVKQ